MNIFKNFHKDKNLTSNCILCNQNKRENLHHIIYDCPAYDSLRTNLKLPDIEMEDASIQLLQDDSLTNFAKTHPNMLKIHDFLSLRWKKLNTQLNLNRSTNDNQENAISMSTFLYENTTVSSGPFEPEDAIFTIQDGPSNAQATKDGTEAVLVRSRTQS